MEIRGPRQSRYAGSAAPLTAARARVLEFLQQRAAIVSAEELALEFDQHVNTVRGHLEFLVAQGLALRDQVRGPGPGRPAWRYRANPEQREADPRVREYGALAGALAAHIAHSSDQPAEDGYAAGLGWGTQVAEASGLEAASGAAARRNIVELLDDLGFAPVANARRTTIHLTQCPLLDVAQRYPDVVCAVHRGLVAGALDHFGREPSRVRLEPFSTSHACLLTLDAQPNADSST